MMAMMMLALIFTVLLGFGVVGLLFKQSKFEGLKMKRLAFAVAWGALSFAAYGVFLVIIWPAG